MLLFYPIAKGLYKTSFCSIANPCQFRNIQLSLFESGIMPKKDCGNAVGGYLRSSNLLAFGLGVRHSRAHTASNHCQLQLTEHPRHLQKCLAHRVCLALPTVQRDRPHNDKAQTLFQHGADDFTKLLCASGKTGDFRHNDAVLGLSVCSEIP